MKQWTEFVSEAGSLRALGSLDEADAVLTAGLLAFPNEMWMHFHHARLADQRDLHHEAVERWERFQSSFPTRPEGAIGLVEALLKLGAWFRASDVVRSSIDYFGFLPQLVKAKAKLHEHWHEWDAAIYCWSVHRSLLDGKSVDQTFPKVWPRFQPFAGIKAFGYWNSSDHSLLQSPSLWRHVLGEDNYRVVGDHEIESIISSTRPKFLPIYRSIRIASCKSDVARFVYLAANGGLYMDMHVALGDPAKFPEIARMHSQHEATFFAYREENGRARLGSSLIMSQPGGSAITAVLDHVEENLTRHFADELVNGPNNQYNIFVLSGPGAILKACVDQHPDGTFSSKQDHTNIFVMHIERHDEALRRYHHYSYRKPGLHWSERQKSEPLFER